MKAAVIRTYGPPEVLTIEDVPAPDLRPNDVLVEVHAASVNPVDTKIRQGAQRLVNPKRFPAILGMDVSGVVLAVGPQVTDFAVGDEVYSSPSHRRPGTYAEQVAIDAGEVARKPKNLTHQQAAAVPLVGLTTYDALVTGTGLKPGETVLIHAGAGGVGTFAIQYAKHLGATVVTTCSARNAELVQRLGADRVIDYTAQRFEDGLGHVDVILDGVGGDTRVRSMRALPRGGRLAELVTGMVEINKRYGPYLGLLVLGLSVVGQKLAAAARGRRLHFALRRASRAQLEHLTGLIEAGAIEPIIDRVFPLDEIAAAHAYVETGRARGKVVIAVQGP